MAGRSERTLREIIRVVAGRFAGMCAVFLIVVASVGVASWYVPRWYRSEVELLAKPAQVSSPLEAQVAMHDQVSLYISTLRTIIARDRVLAMALLCLEEGNSLPPQSAPVDPGDVARWRRQVDQWNRKVDEYIVKNTEEVARLRKRLSVVTPGGPETTFTQTLTVRVDWPEERSEARRLRRDSSQLAATRAHDLAGNIVAAYTYRYAEIERKRIEGASKLLSERMLSAARAELTKATGDYNDFIRTVDGTDLTIIMQLSAKGAPVGETGKAGLATRFAGEITTLDETIAGLVASQDAVRAQLAGDADAKLAIPDAVAAANPAITALQDKVLGLTITVNALIPRYTEEHQEVRNARSELAAARKELREELARQLIRLGQEESFLKARRAVIRQRVEGDRRRLAELAVQTSKYQQLKAAMDAAQRQYDTEKDKVISAAAARELANTSILVTVLGEPSMPDPSRPRRPIMWLNLLFAGFGGLILALVYAFTADHFDHSLKSIDDAERYLGVPVLASVPKLGRNVIRARKHARVRPAERVTRDSEDLTEQEPPDDSSSPDPPGGPESPTDQGGGK